MAYTMVQGISKLSLKMGVLLRGSVYEQKKCVRSPSVFITLGTYPRHWDWPWKGSKLIKDIIESLMHYFLNEFYLIWNASWKIFEKGLSYWQIEFDQNELGSLKSIVTWYQILNGCAKCNWDFKRLWTFQCLRMFFQKTYIIAIKRFYRKLPFSIKKFFCEATLRTCGGSESRTRTYAAPCRYSILRM